MKLLIGESYIISGYVFAYDMIFIDFFISSSAISLLSFCMVIDHGVPSAWVASDK